MGSIEGFQIDDILMSLSMKQFEDWKMFCNKNGFCDINFRLKRIINAYNFGWFSFLTLDSKQQFTQRSIGKFSWNTIENEQSRDNITFFALQQIKTIFTTHFNNRWIWILPFTLCLLSLHIMKFIYLSNQVCLWKLSTEPMGKIWNLFKVQSSIDKFFVPHKQWIRASEETHFKILWVRSERCENILKGWGLKSQYVAQFVVIVNPRKNQKFKPTSSKFSRSKWGQEDCCLFTGVYKIFLFRTCFHRDHRAPYTKGPRTPTVYSCQTGQWSAHTTAPFAAIPA